MADADRSTLAGPTAELTREAPRQRAGVLLALSECCVMVVYVRTMAPPVWLLLLLLL
jgi:hypothetical protein